VHAVRAVGAATRCSPLVTRRLIAGFARQRRDTPSAPTCLTGSPARESDVLRLITAA
jgi:hypothetical protein